MAKSYKRKKPKDDKSAREILVQQSNFFHEEGLRLTEQVIKYLSSSGTSASVLLQTFRSMLELRDKAVNAASKLIPYEEARKESVSIQSEQVHRYVIACPEPVEDVNVWLERCKAEMSGRAVADDLRIDRAIEHAKLKNSHATETIEDEDNPLDEIPE
jgi:hypothetical protein